MKRSIVFVTVVAALTAGLLGCGLPRIPAHSYVAPAPVSTPIEVCWLETGGTHAAGGFGAAGWARAETWEATTSALLVRHPKGDFLIDSGLSPDGLTEAKELRWWPRFVFSQTAGRNEQRGHLPDLLAKLGVSKLDGIILSHVHPDHAGGVGLLPGVPIWLPAEEQLFVESGLEGSTGAVLPAQARAMKGRISVIPFAKRHYANYEQSWDVFEDGSVVVVPTFGHTPGSVATFLNLGGRRLVHVGDLINLQESVDRAVTKSALMRGFTDEDAAATDKQVARLVELHQQDPSLWILPAHDRVAYEGLFGPMPIDAGGVPRCVSSSPSTQKSAASR
jgi:N-acyl homoserine lactone hydrolase